MRAYIILMLTLMACSAPKNTNTSDDQEPYKTMAEERFEGPVTYEFNENKTRVLCVSATESTPKQPRNTVSFFVYDLDSSSAIYEGSLEGSVNWFDNDRVETFAVPGKMPPGQTRDDIAKIYDLNAQKSYTKTEFLKKSE